MLDSLIYKMKWAWRDAQAEGADGDEAMKAAARVMIEAMRTEAKGTGNQEHLAIAFRMDLCAWLDAFAKENRING